MARKSARAVCWVEKAIAPPLVNYGSGEHHLEFDGCYAYTMDFVTNELDDSEGDVPDISKSIKEKMDKYFPDYKSCNPFLDDPQKKPSVDFTAVLEDSEGGDYPFRGFAHCLLEVVKKLRGDKVFEEVKTRWQHPKSVEQLMLKRQNEYRAYRNTPPLVLDPELTKRAAKWANHMSNELNWHSDFHSRYLTVAKPDDPDLIYKGSRIGETSSLEAAKDMSPQDRALSVVNLWHDEKIFYRWPYFNGKNSNLDKMKCFTQTVWKATTNVGYGVAHRKGTDDYLVVAFYWPAGNIVTDDYEEFRENVVAVKGA
ncbi:Golgi-associated plant pathogenesis-related protein 1, partial [Orchesella cincta]